MTTKHRGWWLDEREPQYFGRGRGAGVGMPPRPPRPPVPPNAAKPGKPSPTADDENPELKVPSWVAGATSMLAGLLIVVGGLIGVGTGNENVMGALIVAPVLYGLTMLVARHFERVDGNTVVGQYIMAGFVVKCLGVVLRYGVGLTVYGASDATEYFKFGKQIGHGLRGGQLISQGGSWVGTNFLRLLTGIIYTVTPMSMLAGFLVFGWLSYMGGLFFWRAYRRAISDRNDLRYLTWIILLPTMVYWPSSIGKEAWMVFCLGAAAYGVACVLTNAPLFGFVAIAGGVVGVSQVRPHLGLTVVAGLVLAMLFRKLPGKKRFRGFLAVGLVALVGMFVVGQASSFLGVDIFSTDGVTKELNDVNSRTAAGGSEFSPVAVNSPADFPLAAVTVLFRPFPFEAHNAQSVAVAIESMVIVGVIIVSRKRWLRALRNVRKRPYVLYCIGSILTFVYAYSSFANFGLIARQRSQIMPLLLALLLFPLAHEEPETEPEEEGPRPRGAFLPPPPAK
jgi:hypothetical protein